MAIRTRVKTKTQVKSKLSKSAIKRIVDTELKKGAIVYNRRLLYRPTKSGGEIQTNRTTGERELVSGIKPEVIRKLR